MKSRSAQFASRATQNVKILSRPPAVIETYEYDGRNFRIMKKVGTGTERHSYYNSRWQLLEERLNNSPNAADPERVYVWGKRYIDDLAIRERSESNDGTMDEKYYVLQDVHYNVVAICDGVTPDERMDYNAYGQVTFLDGSYANPSPSSGKDWDILYAGYRYDAGTGLYYVRNRTYHAQMGRWLQRDPKEYIDGLNLYEYAMSRPNRLRDPFGTTCCYGIALPEDQKTALPKKVTIPTRGNGAVPHSVDDSSLTLQYQMNKRNLSEYSNQGTIDCQSCGTGFYDDIIFNNDLGPSCRNLRMTFECDCLTGEIKLVSSKYDGANTNGIQAHVEANITTVGPTARVTCEYTVASTITTSSSISVGPNIGIGGANGGPKAGAGISIGATSSTTGPTITKSETASFSCKRHSWMTNTDRPNPPEDIYWINEHFRSLYDEGKELPY